MGFLKRAAQIRSIVLTAAMAAPGFAESVFPIIVKKNGVEKARGLGVMVAEERLLTSSALTAKGDRYLVLDPAGTDRWEAVAAASKPDMGLALVSAPRLRGEPVTLAKQVSGAGRQVHLLLSEGVHRDGAMHSVGGMYRFSPVPGKRETGAPLMNNCGELLTISRTGPESSADKRDDAMGVSNVPLTSVKAFLNLHKVAFDAAAMECPSLKQQIDDRVEAEKKLQQQIAQKEQQLEELRQNEDERQAEVKKLVSDLGWLRKQLKNSQDATKNLQTGFNKLAQELEYKDETIQNKEKTIKNLEEERRLLGIFGVSIAALVLLIGALMGRRLRQRRHALQKSDAALASARISLERSNASFSDVILTGEGPDGEELRIKVNGSALAQSDAGQLIGRASADADYVITLDSVSRQHARLRVEGDSMTIEDMNSLNGTSVDGVGVELGERRIVKDGAQVVLGEAKLQIRFLKQDSR